jgi:hypothetical protein
MPGVDPGSAERGRGGGGGGRACAGRFTLNLTVKIFSDLKKFHGQFQRLFADKGAGVHARRLRSGPRLCTL